MADLVYSTMFGLRKLSIFVECVFLEEEADFVPTRQEVVVAYVIVVLACGELGHRVIVQREIVQHLVGLGEQ